MQTPALSLPEGITAPAALARRAATLYWGCQIGGWSLIALINIVFSLKLVALKPVVVCFLFALASVFGLLLSHGWRAWLRKAGWLSGPAAVQWLKLGGGILVISAAQTVLVSAEYAVLKPAGPLTNIAWLPSALTFWTFTFSMWTTLYAMVTSARRARHAEDKALRLDVMAKDAELRALQAQINPHFFFNSLNSVRALIFENPQSAADMIDRLASLMRFTLQSGSAATVTLAQELEAVQAYLAIEQIRFEERLRLHIDVPLQVHEYRIPPMALQALVENAVKYGVERSPAGSDIRITASLAAAGLCIEVANQGALVPFADSTRVGLDNTRKRLALTAGAGSSLELTQRDGWVVARLCLQGAA